MPFIRFSNRWINPQWIRQIVIHPTKYCIYCNGNTMGGFMVAGSGLINSNPDIIEIHKENKADYEIMEKWMKSH